MNPGISFFFKLFFPGNYRYLLHYIFSCHENIDASYQVAAFAFTCLFVCLIGLGKLTKFQPFFCNVYQQFSINIFFCSFLIGRMYLGMHSLIDILGGLILGLTILAFWLQVHEYVDNFVILGKNGTLSLKRPI